MYQETLDQFGRLARDKADLLNRSPTAFFVASLMAGAYVGIGIVLIFSVGGIVDPGLQPLVMGVSFGIALTLVVFAGSELFTGHTMYMVVGCLQRTSSIVDLVRVWAASWTFNLIGCLLLALIFAAGGGGILFGDGIDLLHRIAGHKMNSSIMELLARATLCNWLVCLALWMSARTDNDVAKAIAIFWCLFAFIASGFEHSVANMTLLSIALLSEHPETISLAGMAHNLLWVTIGNVVGGSFFVAFGYWKAAGAKRPAAQPGGAAPTGQLQREKER